MPPLPAPAGMTDIQNNSFKNTNIYGKFNVKALVDTSGNTLFEGVSTIVPRGDTCSLFIGDNSYYDSATHYGLLSITRPNATYGNHMTRPHIGLIRRGRTVFQMGYCEKFDGYQDNFSLTHSFGWTNAKMPGITFSNSTPNKIGINNYNPTEIFDVSGNSKFRNDVSVNGQLNINGRFEIVEKKGTDPTVNGGYGSITLIHQDPLVDYTSGVSSIVFKSNRNTGDYGYFKYIDSYNTDVEWYEGGGNRSRFVIGVESHADNDVFSELNKNDCIVIYTPDGNGNVGINKMDPTANLDVSGNTKISGTLNVVGSITSNTSITANTSITTTGYFVTPYVQVNNIINIGQMQSITTSGTINLSLPLKENIFCNTTSGAMTLRMPDTSSLSTSATCTVNIRRVGGTNGISFTSSTGNQIVNASNNTVASLTGITNLNIRFLLFNKLWYFSSHA